MVICKRCGKETQIFIMIFFNTDLLCMSCEEKEQKHPKYAEAKRIEGEYVRNRDFNYCGIGKPKNL